MNVLARALRPLLIVCAAVSLAGCYTLLKHPTTDDGYAHDDFSRCADCHDGYHHFNQYEPLYPDLWWDYYALPWWYDEVMVYEDEGEMPVRRAIHDMNLKLRDGELERSPMGIKRVPPVTGVKEKRESGEAIEESGDKETKKPEKSATKSKRTSKRKRDDSRKDVRRKSDSGGGGRKESSQSGGDTNGDKKRKMR